MLTGRHGHATVQDLKHIIEVGRLVIRTDRLDVQRQGRGLNEDQHEQHDRRRYTQCGRPRETLERRPEARSVQSRVEHKLSLDSRPASCRMSSIAAIRDTALLIGGHRTVAYPRARTASLIIASRWDDQTLRKIETGRIVTPAFFTVAALAHALELDLSHSPTPSTGCPTPRRTQRPPDRTRRAATSLGLEFPRRTRVWPVAEPPIGTGATRAHAAASAVLPN